MSWKTGPVSTFTRQSRRLQRRFFKSRLGFDYAILRARLAKKQVRKVLLVSDGEAYTSEQQFAPIIRFAVPIAQRFGFAFRIMSLEAAQALNARQLTGPSHSARSANQSARSSVSRRREPTAVSTR